MWSISVMPPPSSMPDDAVSCAERRNRATFAGGQPLRGRIAEVGIVATLVVSALLGSACASEQPTSASSGTRGPASALQPIPPTALPGRPADPIDLNADSVAVDAVDVAGLQTLLDEAGYVGGTQRQFSRVRG